MKRFQFSLRALLIVMVLVSITLAQHVYALKMWERTNRTNALSWYRTMRGNLERSRDTLTAAQYQQLRQKIDQDWKRLHPEYEIPDELLAQ